MTEQNPEVDRPDDEVLWRLYGFAVDEYRFQVNLNWQRLQYFLGLDMAILGVGTGVLRIGTSKSTASETLPGLVFVAGVCLGLSGFYLARRQHAYYRVARDRMTSLAKLLKVDHLGVATTAGARGEPRKWRTKVRAVNELVLVVLAVLNAIGAWYAFSR